MVDSSCFGDKNIDKCLKKNNETFKPSYFQLQTKCIAELYNSISISLNQVSKKNFEHVLSGTVWENRAEKKSTFDFFLIFIVSQIEKSLNAKSPNERRAN